MSQSIHGIKIIKAHLREVRVRETTSHTFSTSAGAAFSLVNGMIVGKKNGGRDKAYAIPLVDVLRVHAQTADRQQCEAAIQVYMERLRKIAA